MNRCGHNWDLVVVIAAAACVGGDAKESSAKERCSGENRKDQGPTTPVMSFHGQAGASRHFLASSACRSTRAAVDSENRASPLPSLCPSVERRYQKGITACKWTASAQLGCTRHSTTSTRSSCQARPSCRHNARRLWLQALAPGPQPKTPLGAGSITISIITCD